MRYPDIIIPSDKLSQIISDLGLDKSGETTTDIICYCPFHDNKDTPAFNISKKTNHLYHCWNPGCGGRGNIFTLVQHIKNVGSYEAIRFLQNYESFTVPAIGLDRTPKREYDILDESLLEDFSYEKYDLTYMRDRGFSLDTLRHFGVGRIGNYITVPVWDEKKNLVGISKRSIVSTKRKYLDAGLPKRHVLFNLNNAVDPINTMGECIVVEGPFDAMKVHQSGFPNVVATLSGDLTETQGDLLRRHFRSVIIFTDNDDAGRKLGEKISIECKALNVYWVPYPEGIKDPGQMSEQAIKEAIENKKPNILMNLNKILGRTKT